MNQTQDAIHYLDYQKHTSGMKPGDQPENGRNKALKITLICKFHDKGLSGNSSLLLHGAEQGASLQHRATWPPGPSPRLVVRQGMGYTTPLSLISSVTVASHFASLSLTFFLVICEVVINTLSFTALMWRLKEMTDAENWAHACIWGAPDKTSVSSDLPTDHRTGVSANVTILPRVAPSS